MCARKIEDAAFDLYNIIFYESGAEPDECASLLLCERGKCICVDHEQTGLLRGLLSVHDQIILSDEEGRIAFENLQNKIQNKYICQQATSSETPFYNTFYPNRFSPECKDGVLSMIRSPSAGHSSVVDVVVSIPLLYAVNSRFPFHERNSLIYLCRYAPCAAQYISALLGAVIYKTIGYCQNASQKEKEAYVSRLTNFLNFLISILKNGNSEIKNQYIESLDIYERTWENLFFDRKALAMPLIDALEDYRNELADQTEITLDERDIGTFHSMYCLLRKLLQTADISGWKLRKMPESLFMGEKRDPSEATDYGAIIKILDIVKRDAEKLGEIWRVLSRIFFRGVEVPAEELEKMRGIAGL